MRRWRLGIAIVVILALLAGAGWWYFGRSHKAVATSAVGPKGGTVWSGNVGVRVAPGGVTNSLDITFAPPTTATPESPLSMLMDAGPSINIAPHGGTITNADVLFKVDPKGIPAGRTMDNGGIEVFNETIGTWIPLTTTVENGNILVAHAPHFSIFRTVFSKIGEFTVNAGRAIKVTLTKAMRPIDTLWNVGYGLVKNFYMSITGQFDGSKYQCDKNSPYKVAVTDDTRQGKLAACVVKDGSDYKLLLKNGLAVPFKFEPHGNVPGLGPSFADGNDIMELVRSFADMLLGKVAVSGLDVGAMHMAASTPKQFTVDGSVSWVAAGVDILMGLLTVLLPESKSATVSYREVLVQVEQKLAVTMTDNMVAITYTRITTVLETVVQETKAEPTVFGQVNMFLDAVNCVVGTVNAAHANGWSDLTGMLIGSVQGCLAAAVSKAQLGEAKDAVDLLKNVVELAKTIPEIGQLSAMGLIGLFGGNATKVSFTVRQYDPLLDPLVGEWVLDCPLMTYKFHVTSDYKVTMTLDVGTDPGAGVPFYTITMHLINDGGKPTGVIDTDNYPDWGKVGDKIRFSLTGNNLLLYHDGAGGAEWSLYKQGHQPANYC